MINNRELKFRIWDKSTKKYLGQNIGIGIHDCAGGIIDLNKIFNNEECIIQQLTGLKDIKDNEIYEGDILKLNDGYNSISQVFFIDGCFIIGDKNKVMIGPLWDWTKSEIVGNILENKELLEK